MNQTAGKFFELFDGLNRISGDNEILHAFARTEKSDFVQFNRSRIRNAGTVQQFQVDLRLIQDRRQASARLDLCGDYTEDLDRAGKIIEALRTQVRQSPEDPYLLTNSDASCSQLSISDNLLPPCGSLVAEIASRCRNLDLVGLLSCGTVDRGYTNTFGQRNWHSRSSFNVNWSCYLHRDKAVKSQYAGFSWDREVFRQKIHQVANDLRALQMHSITIPPGTYRVYLTPSAVCELITTLAWRGFGARNQNTRQSPLNSLIDGNTSLHPDIYMCENNREALAPGFTSTGFIKPARVDLIEAGKYSGPLIDSRSACEYGLTVNSEHEVPESLELGKGTLEQEKILDQLHCGLLINNLWYSNFSDINQCGITGMTRFACFKVEDGKIRAPINPMRFDDSLYNLLGTHLHGISAAREWIMDSETYERRSLSSIKSPGLLIDQMKFTL